MNRPVKLGVASFKALGAMIVLGAVAHASLPYLPLIGPPPLRVQPVRKPSDAIVKFQALMTASGPSNALATVENAGGNTNSAGLGLSAASSPLLNAGPDSNGTLGDTLTASIFALPTPDLLGITPQNLATYFRPVQLGTNVVVPVGLLPISFIPPSPPEKSSHAEYNVK
jgi:hypothetical protein